MTRTKFLLNLFLILGIVLLAACGGGGSGGGTPGAGAPTVIGSSGGSVTSSDGKASVIIPAGALSQDTAITVAAASNPPSGNIGTAYEFGPDGTLFSQPVTMAVAYDESTLPPGTNEDNLRLGTVSNNQWIAVADAGVNSAANIVSGTTTHFSVYGLISLSGNGVVPAAPTEVAVAPGDSQVTISWKLVEGATSYNLYMASESGVTKSNYTTLTDGMQHVGIINQFVQTGLTNGTTYYFVITAVNVIGESAESDEISATPTIAIAHPAGPSNLQTLASSSVQILLSWTDHADNENGFEIERKTGANGSYNQIATVGTDVKFYADHTGLAASTLYCYQIRAFNGIGVSDYSNESCATTLQPGPLPPSPSEVTAVPGFGQVTLKWKSVSGATSYKIYTAAQSGVNKENYSTLPGGMEGFSTATTFVQSGLSNGVGYFFVITTVNNNGESLESAEVTSTPTTANVTLTGNMTTIRFGHTATLLANGKVLIAGGLNSSGALASAELYDPATGTFNPTSSMNTARSEHTATLLVNGKVLIAGGGSNSSGTLASAELYDPDTETFSPTGDMKRFLGFATANPYVHTATLLPDGKVLVAGGGITSPVGILESAELYDPAVGTFSLTNNMGEIRSGHTATLLPSGKVLITGGVDRFNSDQAELYDPATSTFSPAGRMVAAHDSPTATLLTNGSVLIVGRGQPGNFAQIHAETYDPATNTFRGAAAKARGGHTATLLTNGKVLIASRVGGINDLELYDMATGTFSPMGPMIIDRSGHTATLLANGKVLIASGNTAELYDPGATFGASKNMTTLRYDHTATLLNNGNVLIAGGHSGENGTVSLPSAELYDPITGVFSHAGFMSTTRALHTSTLLANGKVLFVGGGSAQADLYDPITGTFSPTGTMKTVRWFHTATLLTNGKVLVTGGFDSVGNGLTSAELYDPATGVFNDIGNMGTARNHHTAARLNNGKVLIAGGRSGTSGGPSFSSAEIYDPATGSFSPTGSMTAARSLQTATLLGNGKVFLFGNGFVKGELYDPVTGTFSATAGTASSHNGNTVTLLSTGSVLIAGGASGTFSTEIYHPGTDIFSLTGRMRTVRSGHTATLLTNGEVLIAGGKESNGVILYSAEIYNSATGTFSDL